MTLSNRDSVRFLRLSILICACVGLAALTPGCTTRKQYAINEAILIGERRQLEDEIYRTQFELRDALVENEKLRAELEGSGKGAKSRQNGKNDSSAAQYPGGATLQVAPTSSSNALGSYGSTGGEEVERLPDFVPVPVSRSKRNGASAISTPGPAARPLTTPTSDGSSNQRSSGTKANSRAFDPEANPYTFGQNDANRSNYSSRVVSSSYLGGSSDFNGVEQTSYQEKARDESEIEPWSPLAPY